VALKRNRNRNATLISWLQTILATGAGDDETRTARNLAKAMRSIFDLPRGQGARPGRTASCRPVGDFVDCGDRRIRGVCVVRSERPTCGPLRSWSSN